MKSKDDILAVAINLCNLNSYDKITFADIAKKAGVHWTTVQRCFGNKENMRKFLLEKQLENDTYRADTRTKILEAGSRIFAKYGYEGSTLDQIANEAGVSKGALYWHFSNKSDLYHAIFESSLSRLIHNMPEQFKAVLTSANQLEAIEGLLKSEFKACEHSEGESPRLFMQFISCSNEKDIKEKLGTSFSNLFTSTSNIIRGMQSNNLINPNIESYSLAVAIHALINGIVLMWLANPKDVMFDTISTELAKMLWYGIQPKEG